MRYSAYGDPFLLSAGDLDSNGLVNINDAMQYSTWAGGATYDRRGDLNNNGMLDSADATLLTNLLGLGLSGGRGVQSRGDVNSSSGYAGYTWDAAIGANHVRNRSYKPDLGRWLSRDPLGYHDGLNLYEYGLSSPLTFSDALGLAAALLPREPQSPPPPTSTWNDRPGNRTPDLHLYNPDMLPGELSIKWVGSFPVQKWVFGEEYLVNCCVNAAMEEGGDILPARNLTDVKKRIDQWKQANPGVPLRRVKFWDHAEPGDQHMGPDTFNPGAGKTNDVLKALGPGCEVEMGGCNVGYGERGRELKQTWELRYPHNPLFVEPSLQVINPIPWGPPVIQVPACKKNKGELSPADGLFH